MAARPIDPPAPDYLRTLGPRDLVRWTQTANRTVTTPIILANLEATSTIAGMSAASSAVRTLTPGRMAPLRLCLPLEGGLKVTSVENRLPGDDASRDRSHRLPRPLTSRQPYPVTAC